VYTGFWWGQIKERRPLGRPRHRGDDNIKMDLQDVGWGMDWIVMAEDRDRWRAVVTNIFANPLILAVGDKRRLRWHTHAYLSLMYLTVKI
jgi:hypothetical protein